MDLALPTTTSSNPLVPTESLGPNSTSSNEEPPSSFPRAPQTATTEDVEPAPPSPDPSNKKKRPKARDNGGSLPEDPADQLAIAHANLAAAPIVGVVGYGPGTGGGSGIRRHTPSCDFCKRRKERCVGGPPCQTCANRGLECTFDMVNKSHFDRKRAKKPSTNDLGAPIVPLVPPKPAKPAEKAPRTFAKRDNVSEVACMFCRGWFSELGFGNALTELNRTAKEMLSRKAYMLELPSAGSRMCVLRSAQGKKGWKKEKRWHGLQQSGGWWRRGHFDFRRSPERNWQQPYWDDATPGDAHADALP
ncbi:hypothetical protein M407DRAFT_20397 [Tulasnella calospora MUT 4182]|uniref:Zn(2)-C6 fungal-type domain-containing protein n=1 Tax=Tulasnella calospora MUT 4182 TaxID=1051891 RepID=A0A0C3QQ25_9AGAM|nr:hypothetical protein M407DRAFT_20397 [Tulasnella calospora MUT 4182]